MKGGWPVSSEELSFNNPENKCPLFEIFPVSDETEMDETIWHPV